MAQRTKVIVAMSGGVDSSVAAALLVEQGYDVHGVSLRMWEGNAGPRVCSDHRGAGAVARQLGIPHTLLDLRAQFAASVVKPFAADYLAGRTPNPCVACNRDFKLGSLLSWAREQGADYVASGHYARITRAGESYSLWRGADGRKDQSYFLFALSQQQLARALFPLGEMQKRQVRQLAERLALPAAQRPESQDICFGDYQALVASYAELNQLAAGDIVDGSGRVLGQHSGVHTVTIGQRRGLGICGTEPLYVARINATTRQVVVATKQELGVTGMIVRSVNWLMDPGEAPLDVEVQIRYRARALPCVVRRHRDGAYRTTFKEPVPAVAPGQAAVFYRGEQVLGGGWIDKVVPEQPNSR
jgi:tRNA-specific 2-thiouridylase